ncbi:MAG: amidase, partial [Promicromonosporaceae bacterium]|nr:amidase [Promicromonosporaceae bacterium]
MASAVAHGPLSTVEGCVAALASGEVTAVDLVRRGLERIERFDGPAGLNAIITVADDALTQAKASDERRAARRLLGPLDGVPYTVKDNIETAELRTTHGTTLFAGWVPEQDAPIVARLRQAGMVLLAKVSLDDYAGACWGESSLLGPMRNPYDPTRMVGGSSGGSAVAVAAGYAPLSLGTDTGGSLRIPAALCGVATLRPTAGLLPLSGIFPRSPSQDVVGPMAATVEGLRLSLAALRGLPVSASPPSLPDPSGLRLGVVEGGLAIWGDEPEGPVLRRFREVVTALRTAGVTLVPMAAPPRQLLDDSPVIALEARTAIDAYLARTGMPVGSFAELLTT